jgi:hypothetical protein
MGLFSPYKFTNEMPSCSRAMSLTQAYAASGFATMKKSKVGFSAEEEEEKEERAKLLFILMIRFDTVERQKVNVLVK